MDKYREYEAYLDAKEKELGESIDKSALSIILKLDYLIDMIEKRKRG